MRKDGRQLKADCVTPDAVARVQQASEPRSTLVSPLIEPHVINNV